MRVLVVANETLKDELLNKIPASPAIKWTKEPEDETGNRYDACIDLNFENTTGRVRWLSQLQAPLIIINSVITPLTQIHSNFVRVNGWPTFLKRHFVEAATANELNKSNAEKLFSLFDRKTQWVADIPGFITPRIVASIINEAWFALEEEVSTIEEIDIAMKLGTNYPFGPFEWSEKIGLWNIYSLLKELSKENSRYDPAKLLTQNANK